MGKSDAKAIKPKPSVKGLLPSMTVAKPTPRAVTRGTGYGRGSYATGVISYPDYFIWSK